MASGVQCVEDLDIESLTLGETREEKREEGNNKRKI